MGRAGAWPEAMVEGVVLAAAVLDDLDGARALAGLGERAREEVGARARAARETEGAGRAELLRALAARQRPAPTADTPLSPRARATVAALANRAVASGWLASAPRPRRGFAPTAGLRGAVLRGAVAPARAAVLAAARDEVARKERGVGRELFVRLARALPDDARERALAELGAEEASAVLALEPHVDPDAGTPDRALHDAARIAAGEIGMTRALGALALGASGDLEGDERSAIVRRAGKELMELDPEGASWRA